MAMTTSHEMPREGKTVLMPLVPHDLLAWLRAK